MKTSFFLWIFTIVVASVFLILQAPNRGQLEYTVFILDILLGIYLYVRFNFNLGKYFHKRFGKVRGPLLSIFSVFFSFVGGITPLLIIAMIGSKYFAPQTTKNKISQTSLSIPTTIPVKEWLISDEVQMGSWGENVTLLQLLLSQDGTIYFGPVSGYFGQITRDALIKFQKKYGLSQTGKADIVTRTKFGEIYGSNTREYWLRLLPTTVPVQTVNSQTDRSGGWGEAMKDPKDDVTYHMRIGSDPIMTTVDEIFQALNTYRSNKGTHGLNWDGNLASYAQERANYYAANGVDAHRGFVNFIDNEDGYHKLGFAHIGENGSTGMRLTGTHLIEWIFSSDPGHDGNQLDNSWSDVGIGVSGTSVDIIFGGNRL